MNEEKMPPAQSLWQKTQFANLVRYIPSGVYFARFRVKGKLIRKSLKTKTLTVAKLRLGDLAKAGRQTAGSQSNAMRGKMTFGDAHENPALGLKRAAVRPKKRPLPGFSKFSEFIMVMENAGTRFSHSCADLARFLAYGGFRKSEAANIQWQDCDFAENKITVFGDPESRTKNGRFRSVPMIPDMALLLGRLRKERPDAKPTDRVMLVQECQKSMDRTAKVVGMSRITHHDLRHLFATRGIESGVDIPTVSRWLGHKDGGALAMKTYGHLRNEHSQAMAQKVKF
jgi:integrase